MIFRLTGFGSFFLFGFLFFAQTGWAVEIYSGGRKYASVEEYRGRASGQEKSQNLTYLNPRAKELDSVRDFLAAFVRLLPAAAGIGMNQDGIGKIIEDYLQGRNVPSGLTLTPIDLSTLEYALGQENIVSVPEHQSQSFSN